MFLTQSLYKLAYINISINIFYDNVKVKINTRRRKCLFVKRIKTFQEINWLLKERSGIDTILPQALKPLACKTHTNMLRCMESAWVQSTDSSLVSFRRLKKALGWSGIRIFIIFVHQTAFGFPARRTYFPNNIELHSNKVRHLL